MAASPDWKVYKDGEYRAACKYVEDAAVLVAALGDGTEIRYGHSTAWTVWVEGQENQSAGESYDEVARVARVRLAAARDRRDRRIAGWRR